ncbi:MAG: RHS repeat-associated core domain-containing protein, partial [Polyangiaceae bacterium]
HPIRLKRGGTTVFLELDLAGNVRRLRAPGGGDLGGYGYSAFGKQLEDTASASFTQPYRWKGRPRDVLGGVETYDMRARVWLPEVGVFSAIDELAFHSSRTTLWGWPSQSPVRWADQDGRCGQYCVGAVIGGVLGGLYYAATASTDQTWGEFAAGAAQAAAIGAGIGVLTAASPQAGFVLLGGLGVSSDRDLWKLGLGVGLVTSGGGASCPTRSGGPDAAPRVHGNSTQSAKAQHGYEIVDTTTGDVVKTGVSGGRRTATGGSARANSQANRWNREAGEPGRYEPRVVKEVPAGAGSRQEILEWEAEHAAELRAAGHLRDPTKHKRP